jgi:uncharacterized membrane protein YozB (DUF420 family)
LYYPAQVALKNPETAYITLSSYALLVFIQAHCYIFPSEKFFNYYHQNKQEHHMVTYDVVHEWMAQANIIIILAALLLIGASLYLEKKRRWVWHGNSMMIVMLITVLLVIAHMGPSFVRAVNETITEFNYTALAGVIHGLVGAAAVALGVWLLWIWAINESSSTQYCAPRKKRMWKILALWLLSLALGVLYYLLHITFG